MFEQVLWMVLLFCTAYTLLPTVLIRRFGFGVYRGRNDCRSAALTFDDGPDPRYTPRLLDLLAASGARATFFVLGAKAEHHPELIRRMHEEGHLVGLHNYKHHSNGLMTPWKVRRSLRQSADIIERIIGTRPVHYRPPWGVFNVFDLLLIRRFRIVLWSTAACDWRSSGGKEKILLRLRGRIRSGAVILLHDSGDTLGANREAPAHMLEALAEILAEARRSGLCFERVDEQLRGRRADGAALPEAAVQPSGPAGCRAGIHRSRRRSGAVALWMRWERMFHRLYRVRPADPHHRFLHYRLLTYRGQELPLGDGERIRPGDLVAELHLGNEWLCEACARSGSVMQLAVHMIRSMESTMPVLAGCLLGEDTPARIKGVYGISMIHRGTERFGFTVLPLKNGLWRWVTTRYLHVLMGMLHPGGFRRLHTNKAQLEPRIIAMSAVHMRQRYASVTPVKQACGLLPPEADPSDDGGPRYEGKPGGMMTAEDDFAYIPEWSDAPLPPLT
ncbi:polysaccharide deacetylase family protein [Paenibacillus lutrae]|uniref:Polysaccharide deacetylase family protein n=1 Tax=Paenibacillus lutrae TaxID=2078573 RepID=A0A7X3K0M0_9BACL|nr:polysaccharide deacetylase family protein [Paenibacillus lutrae]MVP01389.1 polysaccharide deacetylase family protein [Paenibacillus lutrae]